MRKTYTYLITAVFLFSSMEVSIKIAGASFDGIQLNFLRFAVGGMIMFPVVVKNLRGYSCSSIMELLPNFFLTGFICVVLSMGLYQIALEQMKASTVAVIFSCNPIFSLIFSYLFFKEKVSRKSMFGIYLTVIGLVVIMNPIHLAGKSSIFFAVLSALLFGLYTVLTRQIGKRTSLNVQTMTSLTFIVGAAELGILMLISNVPAVAERLSRSNYFSGFANSPFFSGIELNNLWLLLYICVLITAVGFTLYFEVIKRGGMTTASLIFFVKPALAPLLAVVILKEKITLLTLLGIIFIVLGSFNLFVAQKNSSQL